MTQVKALPKKKIIAAIITILMGLGIYFGDNNKIEYRLNQAIAFASSLLSDVDGSADETEE